MRIKLYRLCKKPKTGRSMSIRLWVLNLVSSYQQVILIRYCPSMGMNFWTPQTGKMGDGWQYTYTANKIRGFKTNTSTQSVD